MEEIKVALFGSARAAILDETIAILALDPSRRLLTFLRQKAPTGWTIPAGHWERNESALDAAGR
jgi:8-oxo-dGTP pyrophosphatase MutT (NUDIX family)